MDEPRTIRVERVRRRSGCFGIPVSGIWLFFTLMYFFTEEAALPTGKLEFFWRFLAGPFNLLF